MSTFGGSRLDRYVYDFEPLPAGEVNLGNFREGSDAPYAAVLDSLGLSDAPAAPAPGEPATFAQVTPIEAALAAPADPYAAPAAVAAPAPTAAPPVPVATDPYAAPVPAEPVVQAEPTPAWVQNIETSFAQLGQQLAALGAPAAPAEPAAAAIDFDTATGDEIRAHIDGLVGQAEQRAAALVERAFQERLQPFMPALDTIVANQAQEAARAHFAALEGQVGRFDHDQAFVRTRALMAEYPNADPEQALLIAAQQQHEFEKAKWEEFKTLTGQTATAVAGAPPAAPVAPAAASEIRPVHQGPDRYEAARADFFARRNVQPVTA